MQYSQVLRQDERKDKRKKLEGRGLGLRGIE
jgi:hypothetical protein